MPTNNPNNYAIEKIKALSPMAEQNKTASSAAAQTTNQPQGSQKTPTKQINLTLDWFANGSGLHRRRPDAKVEFLNCGKKAFSEIYKAIANATKSIEIVMWGFDPMMRFNPDMDYCKDIVCYRDIDDMTLGQLLEYKATQHQVKVKILVWYSFLPSLVESTARGIGYNPAGDQKPAPDRSADYQRLQQLSLQQNQLLAEQQQLEAQQRAIAPLSSAEELQKEKLTILKKSRRGLTPEEQQQLDQLIKIEQQSDPVTYANNQQRLIAIDAQLAANRKEIQSLRTKLDIYNERSNSGAAKAYPEDQVACREWVKRARNNQIANLSYETRGFTPLQHAAIGYKAGNDDDRGGVGWGIGATVSHHQKLVLIDYDTQDPAKAVAFVMGHNMHRQYWDGTEHYYDDWDANRPTGFGPWQDISTKVHGSILYDINDNIVKAWRREFSHLFGLIKTNIPSDQDFFERRAAIPYQKFILKPDSKVTGYSMQAQFCRTQMQEDNDRTILEVYQKAIGNACNYIYMENQYFRYPPIIQKVVDRATQNKTALEKYGAYENPLYLFVLTNTPGNWQMSSTTYDTLKVLNQEQLMPEAQRAGYHERGFLHYLNPLNWFDPRLTDDEITDSDRKRLEDIRQQEDIERLSMDPDKARQLEQQRQQQAQANGEPYTPKKIYDIDSENPEERPFDLNVENMEQNNGIKALVGTLTTDSSIRNPNITRRATDDPYYVFDNASTTYPDGSPRQPYSDRSQSRYPLTPINEVEYRNIYIHSKLLIVDDLFTFVGSANLNTRSFMGDTESGIAMPNPDLAYTARTELWQQHAKQSIDNSDFTASKAIHADGEANYKWWNNAMNNNWKLKAKEQPLFCHITRFWDTETGYARALD